MNIYPDLRGVPSASRRGMRHTPTRTQIRREGAEAFTARLPLEANPKTGKQAGFWRQGWLTAQKEAQG